MFFTIEIKRCTVVTYIHWSLSFSRVFLFLLFSIPASVPTSEADICATCPTFPIRIWSLRPSFPIPSGLFVPPSLPHLVSSSCLPYPIFVPPSLTNQVSSSHLPYPTWSLRPNFPTQSGLFVSTSLPNMVS